MNLANHKVLHLVNILGSSLEYSPTSICTAIVAWLQQAQVKNLMIEI